MTIKHLLDWGTRELIGLDSARLDAELLLAHVLKKDQTYIFTHEDQTLSWWQKWRYQRLIRKRKTHYPVAYLLGKKEFYGLEFEVNPHTLIPRPDTEMMVESLLSTLNETEILIDVGTGSGCIAITALKHSPELIAVGVDISQKALRVAKRNAQLHGVEDRFQVLHSNLLESVFQEEFRGKNVILVANLPYVPLSYQVNSEASFEPSLALYAVEDGVELYRRLFDQLQELQPVKIFVECYAFQGAILSKYLPDYQLKETKKLLGEARMFCWSDQVDLT